MAAPKYPIPSVPASIKDSSQRDWMQKITSVLKAVTGEAGTAAQLDFFNTSIGTGGFDTTIITEEGEYDPYGDDTIPDPPVVQYRGGFSYVIMRVENHDHLRNIAYMEVWGSNLDDYAPNDISKARNISLADADNIGGEGPALVGTATGGVFSHHTGTAFKGYYWARFRNYMGSYSGFDTVLGTYVETALDPKKLLEILEGQITSSQLYGDLASRIDLIDAPGTGLSDRLTVIDDAQTSFVQQTEQWVSQFNEDLVAIEQQFEVVDGVSAQYYVKIDNNGTMSGFGLGSTTSTYDGSVHSNFIVNVDTFGITAPGKEQLVFGVDTVNNRVVMDAAYIVNLTVNNAQIENLAADKLFADQGTIADAIIGEGHIDNAKIGEFIQSDNYSQTNGNSGWRIDKTGFAEFRGIKARGNIEASSIQVGIITAEHIKGGAVSSMDTESGVLASYSGAAFTKVVEFETGIPAGMVGSVLIMVNYQGGRLGSSAGTLGCMIYGVEANGSQFQLQYGEFSIEGNRTSAGATSCVWKLCRPGTKIRVAVSSRSGNRPITNIKVNANRLTTLM